MRLLTFLLLLLYVPLYAQKSPVQLKEEILYRDTSCVNALEDAMRDYNAGILGHRSSGYSSYTYIQDSLLSSRFNVKITRVIDPYSLPSGHGCYNSYMYRRIEEKYGKDDLQKVWRTVDSLHKIILRRPQGTEPDHPGGLDSVNRFFASVLRDLELNPGQLHKIRYSEYMPGCRCKGKIAVKKKSYTMIIDTTGHAELEPAKRKDRNAIYKHLKEKVKLMRWIPATMNGKKLIMTISIEVDLGEENVSSQEEIPRARLLWYSRRSRL